MVIQLYCASSSTEKPWSTAWATTSPPSPAPVNISKSWLSFSHTTGGDCSGLCITQTTENYCQLKNSVAWHKCGIFLGIAEFVKNPCFHIMHQLLSSLKDTDRHLAHCQKVKAFQSIGMSHVIIEWFKKHLPVPLAFQWPKKRGLQVFWIGYITGSFYDCILFVVLHLSGIALYQLSSQFTSLIHLAWKQIFLQKAVLSFQNRQQFETVLEWNCWR